MYKVIALKRNELGCLMACDWNDLEATVFRVDGVYALSFDTFYKAEMLSRYFNEAFYLGKESARKEILDAMGVK
jgi:hypothetical protein